MVNGNSVVARNINGEGVDTESVDAKDMDAKCRLTGP